jgi:ubiquitin-like protein Pup
MPGQEQQRPSRREEEVEEAPAVPAQGSAGAQSKETDADVDALLDEIDEVLESNSEEFVRGFVQKGGE